MAYYFHIAQGLRGCYMPDNAYIVKVETRKQLKDILNSEAYSIRDCGYVGCSKRAIAWLSAEAWRNRKKFTLDIVAPYGWRKQGYPYGVFCSKATRSDYIEYEKENN